MRRLTLRGRTGRSLILVGESVRNLERYASHDQAVLVTDRRVYSLYKSLFGQWNTVVLDRGEKTKTLATVERLQRTLLRTGCDRSSILVGLGGGVISDITGFTASTFMRGIRFGFVPTTLLAQADAAIGGKNGVNLDRYKNIIGLVRQPEFVIADPQFLATLPTSEIRNGLSEVVKSAAIADERLFRDLENSADRALAKDIDVLGRLIAAAARIKVRLVACDENEQGPRAKLNFGHTLGHAVERATGLSHGAAISIGMAAAARLSTRWGLLAERDNKRLLQLLIRLGLPVTATGNKRRLWTAIDKDKKKRGPFVRFVLLERIGSAVIRPARRTALKEVLHDLC
jgi:3-dehydroquinate synthase